jgi:hypothetical protein
MPSYSTVPGNLCLAFQKSDDFSAMIDFSPITMTGYTVSASISSLVTGEQITPLTVSIASATAGKVNVSLTDTQTSAIPRGTYGWNLKWTEGQATRTALSGIVEVK